MRAEAKLKNRDKINSINLAVNILGLRCYGPSVISIMVTKGGHLRGGKLYRTSKTMGRGVS